MSDNFKILLGVLGGALLALLLVVVFLGAGMGGMGSMMGVGPIGGAVGMLFAPLLWLLAVALVVGLVVWVIGQGQRR